MKIYEIKNLDCNKRSNRKKLLNETMNLLNLKEKPSIEDLLLYCKKIKRKYKIGFKAFPLEDCYQINIEVERGIQSIMICYTKYEAICKYILFCNAWLKYKRMQGK